MKRIAIASILVTTAICQSALSFDGEYRGVTFGAGFGVAANAQWSGSGNTDGGPGFSLHFIIGVKPNVKDVLVLEGNYSLYNSSTADFNYAQGFLGPVWYHRFHSETPSIFTFLGIGRYGIGEGVNSIDLSGLFDGRDIPDVPESASGIGYLVGFGAELSDHLQLALYVSGGRTSEDIHGKNFHWKHSNIEIMLTYIRY